MRKILAIILLGVFIFEYTGSYLLLKMAQYTHYDSIKKDLRKNKKYTILAFSINEYNRYKVKGKNEVKIDGKMYDYDKKEMFGDSITLYCVRDYKEEFMLHRFFKNTSRNTDPNQRETSTQCGSAWLSLLYIVPDFSIICFQEPIYMIQNQFVFVRESIGFLQKQTPPPRNIFL